MVAQTVSNSNEVQPGDQYARYQGRVVEITGVYGLADGSSQASYYQIRDGSVTEQVFPHQLTRYVVESGNTEAPAVPDVRDLSLIYINEVTDPKTLSDLPTIGATGAKKILERKPESGYKDLDQLKQINHDLGRVNWDVLVPLLRFA